MGSEVHGFGQPAIENRNDDRERHKFPVKGRGFLEDVCRRVVLHVVGTGHVAFPFSRREPRPPSPVVLVGPVKGTHFTRAARQPATSRRRPVTPGVASGHACRGISDLIVQGITETISNAAGASSSTAGEWATPRYSARALVPRPKAGRGAHREDPLVSERTPGRRRRHGQDWGCCPVRLNPRAGDARVAPSP